MVSKQVDEFLDECVKKSMEHYREGLNDFTALAVALETSLHPDFDPFQMLEFELMAQRYRGQMNVE